MRDKSLGVLLASFIITVVSAFNLGWLLGQAAERGRAIAAGVGRYAVDPATDRFRFTYTKGGH
jgi:hypothetical protein